METVKKAVLGHLSLHRGGTGLLLDVNFFDTLRTERCIQ